MDELSVDGPGRGTPTGVFWRGAGGAARLTEPARGPGLRLHPEAASPAPDAQARPGGRLYLVARSRGGLGATTLAVNLALGLRRAGGRAARRVAILDMDLQFGTVGSCLDLPDRGGMLGLLQMQAEPDAHAVRAALQPHGSGIWVLPAPGRAVPLDALDAARMQAILTALLASHDAVVVDLPPALLGWMVPLLRRADRLLLLTDLSVPSVERARRIADALREDAPDLPVEIIVAQERRPLLRRRPLREAAAALAAPLRHWVPADPRRARLALDRGEPILSLAPFSAWSRSVMKIVASLG